MTYAFNAAIDDLKLDPVEFRVYCHILRRSECWESMANGAKHCKVSERTYRRAVHRLIYEHALVSFTERRGQTNVYKVIPVGKPNQAVQMPVTPVENDRAPLSDLTAPPDVFDRGGVADLTGLPLSDLTDKVLPREVEQEKVELPSEPLQNQDAFQAVARIVKNEVGFLSKRSFDFEQAVAVWGERLKELWQLALTSPNSKLGEKPIWRFQDACERKLDLGLEPPKKAPPPAPPAEPDENGIVLGRRYYHVGLYQDVLVEANLGGGDYGADIGLDGVRGRHDIIRVEELRPLEAAHAA